jgi:hypothetical protein
MLRPLPHFARPVAVGALLALVLLVSSGGGARTAAATTSEAGRVSFRRDVAPVLAQSCSTSSCHGGGSRPPVFDARADLAKMRAALVGVASEERPDHAYVTPGAPQASYLVQKIDEDLVDAECADHDCGSPMPLDNPSLPESARAKIRTWIAQGARDN